MAIYSYDDHSPDIHPTAHVAESADVIGKVALRENASVWYQAVLRGDNELIEIGTGSNVQDGAILHTDMGSPLTIGANVTVGHQAMLHGCTIGDNSLVGIQAVILNGAVIGRNSLVGAGALVTEGKVFPDNSLIIGSPAKVVRTFTDEEAAKFQRGAVGYVEKAGKHRGTLKRIG
ncbi:gamma carbonic anhydrase family protein [Derxia lacustris]|uniref:gamma carbonic anhydrase family protein n=1 Tax=Derxia lacustris TaxID=764842 RepID=UPI000A17775B|nr:gamma carbonic anhydrase family protein [Derxia lacustris]